MNKTTTTRIVFLFVASMLLFGNGYSKDYYVTKAGNDDNEGTVDAPFLTIAKAASLAMAGDMVYIGEGTYEETIKPANSGTEASPITFQAIEGEKVIISAMQAISGWTSDGGQRYKAQLDWDLGQRNFVMNGETVLDLARWPNNEDGDRFTLNSLRAEGGSDSETSINAYLENSEIPNWDWSNGGSIFFFGDKSGSGWLAWKEWIKDSSAGKVIFDAIKDPAWILSAHAPGDGGDFYLEGIKEALDYKNEWYFDSSTKMLYVILPDGAQPEDGAIAMARRETAVDLKSRHHIHIKNLAIFGGSILIDGTGNTINGVTSLYGGMTRGITKSFHTGVRSIDISWNSVNTTIDKCEIGFGDGSGIWDSGSETTVNNSLIHNFNMVGSYDAPLMIRGQRNAKITHNKVTRGGRDALQIISKGSEVAYNDFSQSNLIAHDCALLYTIGRDLNMDIHHNWFHDAICRDGLYKAAGIYLDNNSGDVRVYRNVVWNVQWTNLQINWKGLNLDIFNNTFCKADGGTMGAWIRANEDDKFENVHMWNNLSDQRSSDADGNKDTGENWLAHVEGNDLQNNLGNSTSFTSYSGNDFTLKAGTPAIDAGRVIDGYTDGYVGDAPDVGAYELGDDWVPGIDWDVHQGPAGNGCYGLPGEACGNDDDDNSVKPIEKEDGITVSPNPFDNHILINALPSIKVARADLYNMSATKVHAWSVTESIQQLLVPSHIKSGIYVLVLTSEQNKQYAIKVVKR